MFSDRIQIPHQIQATYSADGTTVIARAHGIRHVVGVDVFNASTLATHATNYVTLKLINMGTDATGTTVIAAASTSQTGGQGAMTANVAFPLTVTAANKVLGDGDVMGFIYDESTTDVANSHALTVVVRTIQVGPTP